MARKNRFEMRVCDSFLQALELLRGPYAAISNADIIYSLVRDCIVIRDLSRDPENQRIIKDLTVKIKVD